MQKIGDLTLHLNQQAWEVLKLLADEDLDVAEDKTWTYTSAWYNGRERGFTISCWVPCPAGTSSCCLHVAVFEHRNSDSICAIKWKSDGPYLNPPRVEDVPEKDYPNKWTLAHEVGPEQYRAMADWVAGEVRGFVTEVRGK